MDTQSAEFPQPPVIAAADRAAIDRSVRWPVLFFFAAAGFWLLASMLAGLGANLKLIWPTLGEDCPLTNYPKLQAVHMVSLVYGWGFNAAFGVMLWLMSRLTGAKTCMPGVYIVAGKIWSIVVAVGSLSILLGQGTGIEWLEMPRWTYPVLFLSFAVIAARMFTLFVNRAPGRDYISLWYLGAALFSFPWLVASAWIFIFAAPGAAVMSTAINQWYISGLLFWFFLPVGLAAVYYFIPKVSGRELHNHGITKAAFWTLLGIGGWTGLQRLLGGPLPTWMPALSTVAVLVAVLPIGLIVHNLAKTLEGSENSVRVSPALRFSLGAIRMLLLFGLIGVLLALVDVAKLSNFTPAFAGYAYAAILGFFTLAVFGAIAFIVPRLVPCEWGSGKCLGRQFRLSMAGILFLVIVCVVGGITQGGALADPSTQWSLMLNIMHPYAVCRAFAFAVLSLASLAFLRNLWTMILHLGRQADQPTLLDDAADQAPASAHTN